ncbi:MAG: hypothetical protein HKN43_11625 [Rhodothermales bacterium]|nr:hypothetical protein [Rhodothermales bacterium]
MPIDLLQTIPELLDPESRSMLAAQLEVDVESVDHDLPVVVAAVMGGLMKKASSESGVATIGGLLESEAALRSAHIDSNGAQIVERVSVQSVSEGTKALDKIFGSGLDDLIGAVARYCKLPKYRLRDLFGAVGKTVMAELSVIQDKYSFEQEDIAAIILQHANKVNSALPDNLFAALGLRRQSTFASKLKSERSERITAALDRKPTSKTEKLLLRRLLPIAVVVLILLILWIILR